MASMFKKLQNWLGGTSKYYDNLMKSKSDDSAIDEHQIMKAENRLKPLIKKAEYTDHLKQITLPTGFKSPTDKKGEALKISALFNWKDGHYALFINPDRVHDHAQYQSLEKIEKRIDGEMTSLKTGNSLPIWEEVIHRKKEVHEQIVKAAPGRPWTLYKLAKKNLVNNQQTRFQVGGYPQWIINNIDFRRIAPLEFICSYIQDYPSVGLYYFLNPQNGEIEVFRQKL
jgi:hypothetical protein